MGGQLLEILVPETGCSHAFNAVFTNSPAQCLAAAWWELMESVTSRCTIRRPRQSTLHSPNGRWIENYLPFVRSRPCKRHH
eukprot:2656099-Amphidinium_carterae.1